MKEEEEEREREKERQRERILIESSINGIEQHAAFNGTQSSARAERVPDARKK
jgi:hypothetical protein